MLFVLIIMPSKRESSVLTDDMNSDIASIMEADGDNEEVSSMLLF